MSGVTWVAFKQGGVFTGALPVSTGCFCYQLFGHRFVCVIDVMELLEVMSEGGADLDHVSEDNASSLIQDMLSLCRVHSVEWSNFTIGYWLLVCLNFTAAPHHPSPTCTAGCPEILSGNDSRGH